MFLHPLAAMVRCTHVVLLLLLFLTTLVCAFVSLFRIVLVQVWRSDDGGSQFSPSTAWVLGRTSAGTQASSHAALLFLTLVMMVTLTNPNSGELLSPAAFDALIMRARV